MKMLLPAWFILSAAAGLAASSEQATKKAPRSHDDAAALIAPPPPNSPQDVIALDRIIANQSSPAYRIKVGMEQKEVSDSLGAPDVVFARNLWAYTNIKLHGLPPGQDYDALVLFFVEGRVRTLRRTHKAAVLATKAQLDKARAAREENRP